MIRKKRFFKKTPKVQKSLGILGFPKQLKVTHKYVSAPTQLNCVSGTMSTHVFTCNGLYDPDITSSGHQPLYFDQMSLVYNHYHVIASKIKVAVQTTEDVIGPCVGVLWIDDDSSTAGGNISAIAEQGKFKVKNFAGPNHDPNIEWNLGWSAKKYFGGSIMSNDSLKGTSGANPTELSYYKFSYNTVDGTSATVYLTITVEYVAIWNELREVAQS